MLLIWASRFFCLTCTFFFTCPVGKWIFFLDLSAPAVTVILISSHENESAEIFGKILLGYVYCCK